MRNRKTTMNRVLLRRIVCAVDLSEQSVPILMRALQLADVHGSELLVVHMTKRDLASNESAPPAGVTDAFLALRRITDTEPYQDVPVRWIMAHGDPAVELARFVRRTNADLTIVGGASPRPSTGVVGTVANAVFRTTGSPVLVIPRSIDDGLPPNPYREVLCGVSSGLSSQTLRYALSLGQEFESRLTILHVDDSDEVRRTHATWVRTDVSRLRAEIPPGAHEWCVIEELVANGDPAEELVKAARDRETDLVVVGSAGMPGSDGGLGAAALGALTLTNANVLIVPTQGVAREVDVTVAA